MQVTMMTLMIVSGVALLFVVWMQSGKVKSVGSSITGSQDIELFEEKKVKGGERFLNILTWALVVSFITFGIILFVSG